MTDMRALLSIITEAVHFDYASYGYLIMGDGVAHAIQRGGSHEHVAQDHGLGGMDQAFQEGAIRVIHNPEDWIVAQLDSRYVTKAALATFTAMIRAGKYTNLDREPMAINDIGTGEEQKPVTAQQLLRVVRSFAGTARETALQEASRIGSAVTLKEIPAKYKGLKVLGRGATTIALDLDADHVLLLTRDRMKYEWLRDQGLAEYVDEFTSYNHIMGMNELPVIVLKAVKLQPLSPQNRRIATKLCKEFEAFRTKHWNYKNPEAVFRAIYSHFGGDEKHVLYRLMNFLANYDSSSYGFDLGPRNFMQDSQGELVVLDPIACSELVGLIHNANSKRYADREAGARW